MSRGRSYRFARFGRGLNTTDGPYGLQEGYEDDPSGLGSESRGLLNVISQDRGNVRRRWGCPRIADLGASIDTELLTSLSPVSAGSSSFAVASTDDGRLVAIDEAEPGVVTQLVASGLSATAPWKFLKLGTVDGQGPVFGLNGTDTPRYTDGTSGGTGSWTINTTSPSDDPDMVMLTTFPNGTDMCYWQNVLWIIKGTAVYWSYPGDARRFPVANITEFDPEDGVDCTAVASVGVYVLIFKPRGIWRIHSSQTSANVKITESSGTTAPRSVVSTERGVFYLDPELGVCITDGSSSRVVSNQIDATLRGISAANKAKATACYVDGHYYLTLPVNGVPLVFDYDTALGSWWLQSPGVNIVAKWDRGLGAKAVGSSATKGKVLELFREGVYRDDTDVFESYWSSPWHTFRNADLRKRCRSIHFDGRGTVDVYVATDYIVGRGPQEGSPEFTGADDLFGGAGTFGGGGLFGDGFLIGEDRVFTPGLGRSWSVSVYSASDAGWEIDAYTMRMTTRKD